MSIPWSDHLDLARCVALIGEDDLREATTAMGRCLFHLQRDLLLEIWSVRTAAGRSIAIATKSGRYASSLEREAKDL